MATVIQEKIGKLNIVSTYMELMKASTAEDSIYIRTKETITDFVENAGSLSEREKADILTQTLSGMTTQITTTAMDMAMKIETENRDAPYALTKLRVDTELEDAQRKKVEYEKDLTQSSIEKMKADSAVSAIEGWKLQADLYRTYGYDVSDINTTTLVLNRNSVDKGNGLQVEAVKKAQADIYEKWSSTVRANGLVDVTQKSDGMLAGYSSDSDGMASAQTAVAKRQELAFDDNMRQHILNSSASMLGTMIGSSTFDTTEAYLPYINKWSTAADYLNTNHNAVAGTLTVTSWPASWPSTGGMTISGTSDGVVSKYVVTKLNGPENTVYINDRVLIDETKAFTVNVSQNDIDLINGTGTVTVSVSVIDDRGIRLSEKKQYTI